MTEKPKPVYADNLYGVFDGNGGSSIVGTFYAVDDAAAIREAEAMGWSVAELRAMRGGIWCEVRS